jgi:hypothetical protein
MILAQYLAELMHDDDMADLNGRPCCRVDVKQLLG